MKTVDKLEHNHPDLILQLPEADRVYRITVCRDDSVVERAKFKEDKCRLGEAAQVTPRDYGADGRFAGELEGIQVSRLQKAAVIGSVKSVWKTLKSSG